MLSRIAWVSPPSNTSQITCVADGATLITPGPAARSYTGNGSIPAVGADDTRALMMAIIDSTLGKFPAYLGSAVQYVGSTASLGRLGQPLVRSALDASTSPLLLPPPDAATLGQRLASDRAVPSVFCSAAGDQPLATLSTKLLPKNGDFKPQQYIVTFADGQPFDVAQSAGSPGQFSFVTYSQGVFSEPWTTATCTTSNNAVVVASDYAAGTPAGCPSDAPIYALQGALDEPLTTYSPTAEADNDACSNGCHAREGQGVCVCGVCVCASGWDGAADCGTTFLGDSYAQMFSTDPLLYKDRWQGMVVLDQRAIIAALSAADAPFPSLEAFPRMLFPASVAVGSINDPTMLGVVTALLGSTSTSAGAGLTSFSLLSTRLEDLVGTALTVATYPDAQIPSADIDIVGSFAAELGTKGVSFTPSSSDAERVSPVIVDCAGNEYPQAYFSHAGPLLDFCARVRIPVVSVPVDGSDGLSTFDSFKPYVGTWSQDLDEWNYDRVFDLQQTVDRRLVLWGLPTGCYRMKFAYASQGRGDLSSRATFNTLSSAAAQSIGYSRPFRVLSPVIAIKPAPLAELSIPFDAPMPPAFTPSVELIVRDLEVGSASQFEDPCDPTLTFGRDDWYTFEAVNTALRRCPKGSVASPRTAGGLEVLVSIVNENTQVEYSLFVQNLTQDCARTAYALHSLSDGRPAAVYTASFPGLVFPSQRHEPPQSVPGLQPFDPSSRVSLAPASALIPPGRYRLKFVSYATSALSNYTVTIIGSANRLGVRESSANIALSAAPSSTSASGLTSRINALLVNTTLHDPWGATSSRGRCAPPPAPCYAITGSGAVLDLNDGTPMFQVTVGAALPPLTVDASVVVASDATAARIQVWAGRPCLVRGASSTPYVPAGSARRGYSIQVHDLLHYILILVLLILKHG